MIIFHIYEPELQKAESEQQNLKQTVGIKMKDKNERSELVK
jgi:DNA helicase TIP49 (TBP-interacting protein)